MVTKLTRRSFFKACGGVLAAAALPAPVETDVEQHTFVVTDVGVFTWYGPVYLNGNRQIAVSLRLPDGRQHAARGERTVGLSKEETARRDAKAVAHLKERLLFWAETQIKKAV